MSLSGRTNHIKGLRKRTLAMLAALYLFPQQDSALAAALREKSKDVDTASVRDCFSYFEKKGYAIVTRSESGATAQITSTGFDVVEGAVHDGGVLPTPPDLAGLMAKRSIRAGILAYCRQFPESYNGDDEIHADLTDQGMGHLLIDQVRFNIWYLSGKNLLEYRAHPLNSDLVFMARITARGMDLLDGLVNDPGVNGDEG